MAGKVLCSLKSLSTAAVDNHQWKCSTLEIKEYHTCSITCLKNSRKLHRPRVVEDLNHLRCNRPKWLGPCDTREWISSTTLLKFDFHPGSVVHNQDTKGKPVANLISPTQVKTETGISNQLGAPCKMVSRLKYCTRRFCNLQELHDLIHSKGRTSAHQCTI
jgi:hypothetical protein